MELRDVKQILTSFWEVSEGLGEEEEREVSYACFDFLHMKQPDHCDLDDCNT